ncbi:MAG: hypothetical protein ACLRP8_15920 [Roseburia intestinalis]
MPARTWRRHQSAEHAEVQNRINTVESFDSQQKNTPEKLSFQRHALKPDGSWWNRPKYDAKTRPCIQGLGICRGLRVIPQETNIFALPW